ncbi:MAG: ABC transporter substrate-binding protein [Desulfobacteraceae bacterium]|nr:ABC transporter substrate-binding protein [Desulfobacteraceae bacterium]
MRKALIVSVVFCIALIAGTAFAGEITKIRIGTEGAYPPFNFVDKNGDLQGFDVDIAKAICKAAGVECEFVMQDWDGLIPGLLAKKFDAIIASMSITQERLKKVDFTKKYYLTPAKFACKKGFKVEITPKGLKGKTVGVQRGTIHDNFVRDKFGKTVRIKSYATLDEANMDLISGRIDLVFADSVALSDGLLKSETGKDYDFIGPGFTDKKWFGEGIGIAVRKGSPELVSILNKAILDIRANGEYQKVNAKHFDFDVYGD